MHKIKTVLRLAGLGLSQRQIAASCQVGQATVSDYLRMAAVAGLKWPDIADWDEDRLRTALAPCSVPAPSWRKTDDPDFAQIRRELQTHKHLTLQLLWQEYREKHPNGYGYSRYCGLYRNWLKRQDVVLRHEHRAGEKLFVDYAGDTIPVQDPTTGEARAAAVFVAVLGASSYTYAEATWTQGLADWIGAHLRSFEFLGGTPEILVPDNLKSGVTRACRYEPDLNRTYEEMATHYGVAVIPARRMKPRDKAKVESGVLVVERWIMAALRSASSSRSARSIRPSRNCSPASTIDRSAKPPGHVAACLNRSTNPPYVSCRLTAISMATGSRPASTSIITWWLTATSTACRTAWSTNRLRYAYQRPRWRSSTKACESPVTLAAAPSTKPPRSMSIGRNRTSDICSGRLPAWWNGAGRLAHLRRSCWSASSPPSRIRSKDSDRAWASSVSVTSTAISDWRPSPSGRCGTGLIPTRTSNPC